MTAEISEHKNKTSPAQTYRRLLGYVTRYWWIALIAIITNAIYSTLDAQLIKSLEQLVDVGFVAENLEYLERVPYYMVAYVIVRSVTGYISEYAMSWVGRMIVQDMRQQLFDHYLRMPAVYYDNNPAGKITSSILFNTDRVAQATTETVKDIMRDGFFVASCIYLMLTTNWRLSLLFLLSAPLIAIVTKVSSQRFRRISRNLQNAMGDITHVANEAIQGYRVVRTYGGESYESKRFSASANVNRRQNMKLISTKAASVGLTQLFAGLAMALVVSVAAKQIVNHTVTPGEFVAISGLIGAILRPMKSLSGLNSQMMQGIAAAQTIFEVLDSPLEVDSGTHKVDKVKGELTFEDVTFAYESANDPALKQTSFTVAKGKTVALVGRSGSGKSTIASLLLRLYTPQSGRILLDGVDIQSYELNNFRSHIAIVSQHVTLFNDSIAANIAYGSLNSATLEQIEHAARLAQAWDFIQDAPNGLQTDIGDNGLMLSGGQRQRLAIARAILKNAPVLILDEATSALDNQSERLIQSALDELMKDRTTIVIAHRLSTIEKADQILVIDNGSIIEQGSHLELLAANGEYARLHSAQFSENA